MILLKDYITKLHKRENSFIQIVATGVSASLQQIFASISGCSNTLLESSFPYAQEALESYINKPWDRKFVSQDITKTLAAHAWRKGIKNGHGRSIHPDYIVGLGITGSIDSGRPKRGDFNSWICLRTKDSFSSVSIIFPKNQDNTSLLGRELENDLTDFLAVSIILNYFNIAVLDISDFRSTSRPNGLNNQEKKLLNIEKIEDKGFMYERSDVNSEAAVFLPEQNGKSISLDEISLSDYIVLPTSANPLHTGHEIMAHVLEQAYNKKVIFVIERDHPMKGLMSYNETSKRVEQFKSLYSVMVTKGHGKYASLGTLSFDICIAIGTDNLAKLADPHYLDSETSLDDVLATYSANKTRFIVFDRPEHDPITPKFELQISQIDSKYRNLFEKINAKLPIISSTELRNYEK